MNKQQRTALDYHCRLAIECTHPRFMRVVGRYSIILSVNSGYE